MPDSKVNCLNFQYKIFKVMMEINRTMCILPHLIGDRELKLDHFDLLQLVLSDRNKWKTAEFEQNKYSHSCSALVNKLSRLTP